jgi:hypothetical protein
MISQWFPLTMHDGRREKLRVGVDRVLVEGNGGHAGFPEAGERRLPGADVRKYLSMAVIWAIARRATL